MELSVIKSNQSQPFQPKTFKNSPGFTPASKPSTSKTSNFSTKTVTSNNSNNNNDNNSIQYEDNDENGPHREMAIDCPVNFVGAKKEPPRYPRPLSLIQNTSLLNNGNNPNSIIIIPNQNSKADRNTYNYEDITPLNVNVNKIEIDTQVQQSKMKKYKEDLQKRKELEEKAQKEQEFLRTSLRGSKKLQELKEPRNRPSTTTSPSGAGSAPGVFNPNYVFEEDLNRRNLKSTLISSHLEIEDIVASVEHVQSYLQSQDEKEDLNVISRFVLDQKFQQILKIHNKVVEVKLRGIKVPKPPPTLDTSSSSTSSAAAALASLSVQHMSNEVFQDISLSNHYAAREITFLFNQPYFKNVILTHDKIIEMEMGVTKEQIDQDKAYLSEKALQYGGDDDIKIVRLVKTTEPLGATVRNEGESVVVGRIVKGGVAEKSGLLHEGDEILEINGHDVRGKTVGDVWELMSGMNGNLTFLIHPGNNFKPLDHNKSKTIHLRALFNYDPEDDNYLPCRDLGFSFSKGDIIHVIDTNDSNWWQAYRDGEDDQILAGLVPSPNFQQQREELKQLIMGDMKENKKDKKCRCVSKRKRRKTMSDADSISNQTTEFLTYEEVELYGPDPSFKRPIVLIGPKDVGRQELRQKLMESDFNRFASAISCTSRPMKAGETNHVEYHFISKREFEQEIANNSFVEYGEYEKHYYGTTMDAIRAVMKLNKTCVLNFHPQAMKVLKSSDLKPYFIFVTPQNIESLRQLKMKQNAKFNDETLKRIIQESRDMDEQYSHMFDCIIIITDLERAYNELLCAIDQIDNKEQWVPKIWLS